MATVKPSVSGSVQSAPAMPLDVAAIRRDFPILQRQMRGRPLAYLDNAATTQKPAVVIDTLRRYYEAENANIHRAVYQLSERATLAYEQARLSAQRLLNAACDREIIFVRGATEGINLVAQSFLRPRLRPGDEVLVTWMEHHSNIVPWQLVCEQTGAELRAAPIDDRGELLIDEFAHLLTERTRLVSVVHVSNALGTVNPVEEIVRLARGRGIPVLIDAAQSAPHLPIDVQALDCDFLVFSGHKLYGPTGIGVLYGKCEHLRAMPPYQGGGDMIRSVTFERTTFQEPPQRFEAGTPHIAGAIGLGAAIDYVMGIGLDRIAAYEAGLLQYALAALATVPRLRLIGTARERAGAISFVLEGVHPHDIGTFLDMDGIAVRTGHHCAQPVVQRFGVPATTRASLAFYNTEDEIDRLVAGLRKIIEVFR